MSVVLLVVLAACGGNNDDNGKKDNNSGSKDKVNNEDSGDSGVSKSDADFPIVDEEIDITIFANKPAQNEDNDWNDILIWNEYKDLTNVNVNWDLQNPDALDETRNIALQGGELPDAFFLSQVSINDLLKYGSEESFVALNDYIEEYAPNLSALMEEDPSIRKAITFPDGNIYSMPAIIEEDFLSLRLSARPWINTEHLKELNMDMPETTDDYYEFLKGVKDLAPAGDNTIPYGGTVITELVEWLSGSFGVMNRGAANANFDLGEDDNIRFYANTDEYKQLLEYLNKLYTEGLIDQEIFAGDWGHFTGLAGEDSEVFSSYVFYDPIDFFGEDVGSAWDSLAALEGPEGFKDYHKVSPSVWDPANLVITSENEHPEATVRWMDYFYSEEGSQLYYMGVEGETFEVVDGEQKYLDEILNPESGTFEQAIVKDLTWIGSINGIITADYFAGGESLPPSMEAAEKIEPFTPDEIWPSFTFTAEENDVLQANGNDVGQHVEEMRDKFISGQADLDKDWDNYLEVLESQGIEQVIEVYQNAFDRYQEN